ncbi:dual specificity protein phosphatase family protein [bacterium]|nr:dual specificity protein phosphatase family protein [bacterium]
MITGFEWIIKSRLAASDLPGMQGPLEDDMDFFGTMGIITIVTLTEKPVTPAMDRFGFKVIHFPIPDMGVPRVEDCNRLCRHLVMDMERGRPVLVHCKGGLGRTGTIVCAIKIVQGKSAADALADTRRINKFYVQSSQQEMFLNEFEEYVNSLHLDKRISC